MLEWWMELWPSIHNFPFTRPPYPPGLTRSQPHQVRQHRRCLGWSLWFGWPWCRELHTVAFARKRRNCSCDPVWWSKNNAVAQLTAVPGFFLEQVWGEKGSYPVRGLFHKGKPTWSVDFFLKISAAKRFLASKAQDQNPKIFFLAFMTEILHHLWYIIHIGLVNQ